jgi:hypothetical protein
MSVYLKVIKFFRGCAASVVDEGNVSMQHWLFDKGRENQSVSLYPPQVQGC